MRTKSPGESREDLVLFFRPKHGYIRMKSAKADFI
jgi:hypothetical protein